MKKTLLTLGLGLVAASSCLTTYTWTGGAANGDWSDVGNWDMNGVPVDANNGNPGLTFGNNGSSIVFSATTLPTLNIPDFGGFNNGSGLSPILDFRSGGAISINTGVGLIGGNPGGFVTNTNAGITRTLFTVGDGVGGGTEDVSVTVSHTGELNRHNQNNTHNFLINTDGTLTFTQMGATDFSLNNRFATFTVAGGAVSFAGSLIDLGNVAGNFVDITAEGGSFTAAFGDDFGDIGAVNMELEGGGGNDSFRSSTSLAVQAVDNGDGTFTVFVPLPPTTPTTPTITVIDMGAINQLVGSAIPMNQAIGQVASNVHNVGLRDLNQRVFRLRNRI